MGGRRWQWVGVLVLVAGVLGPVSGLEASTRPTRPVGPPDSTVAIIGDSIVAGNREVVHAVLEASVAPSTVIDASSGRAISHRGRLIGGQLVTSGIDAVRAVRQAGHRPSLWVIELGTNDRWGVQTCMCPDRVAYAGMRIDRLRAEIGFDQQVLWVNVRNDSIGAAAINEALQRRVGPTFGIIDWDAETRGRSDWFLDKVHPNRNGSLVLGALLARSILAAVARPLPDHCVPPSPLASAGGLGLTSGDDVVALRAARRCAVP